MRVGFSDQNESWTVKIETKRSGEPPLNMPQNGAYRELLQRVTPITRELLPATTAFGRDAAVP